MSLLNLCDELHPETDQLVQRLRNLQWDDVSSELRDRCWREFNRMLSERDDLQPRHQRGGEVRRHDFSRRRMESRVGAERARAASRMSLDRRFRPAMA